MDIFTNLPTWPFTIIAALLGILGALYVRHRNNLAAAATVFHSAFTAEFSAIQDSILGPKTYVDALPRHRAAIHAALQALPKRHGRKLQNAWDDYCGNQLEITPEEYIGGTSSHPDLYPDFKKRFLALHNCLDDLLA